jgi:multidrug efflux pump subunit AcrA (membrane-fusion protein)
VGVRADGGWTRFRVAHHLVHPRASSWGSALQEYANRQLQRGKILVTSRAITTEELEEMISQADAAVNVLRERTSAHELAVALAPVKRLQAEARVTVQQELIRGLEDAIAEHTVVAPFDGFVIKEHAEIGQWIGKGAPVAELVELDHVEIEINVLETYISELRQRSGDRAGTETVSIQIDALPAERLEHPLRGEIVSIVPRADAQSRTFPVKILVENQTSEDGQVRLKPGMFARVTLPVRTIRDAVVIPKDSLVLGQRVPTVWVVVPAAEPDPLRGDAVRPVQVEVDYSISAGIWCESSARLTSRVPCRCSPDRLWSPKGTNA